MTPLSCQKDAFDLPDNQHYLNGAYMSPLSRAVQRAGQQGILKKAVPSTISPEHFFSESHTVRDAFARLVNCNAERVALIPAVSYGMATIAKNLALHPKQQILILGEQFPSNVYPWHSSPAKLTTISPPDTLQGRGEQWNARILHAITPDVGLVALAHAHWTDGTRFDLVAIAKRCREVGAALVIDGTQSVGALPFDVAQIQPDALVVAGYKWLMGPYTLGCAYYGPRFDQGTPLEESWIGRAGSEDFSRLVDYQESYAPGMVRFDVGERSNTILLPMLSTAISEVIARDPERIQTYCASLTQALFTEIESLGYGVETRDYRCEHLFGVRLPARVSLSALKQALATRQIHVSIRGSAVRISPNVYNNEQDIQALLEVLRDALD